MVRLDFQLSYSLSFEQFIMAMLKLPAESPGYYGILIYESIVMIFIAWVIIAVSTLMMFHTFLGIAGKTTYEMIKLNRAKRSGAPGEADGSPAEADSIWTTLALNMLTFHCAVINPQWEFSIAS
jgi:hypothetical protein